MKLKISDFAKLHEVNTRTLHYYDEIKLFSPKEKDEKSYRYYDVNQSIDFEFIKMLKDLGLSIDEIKRFRNSPNEKDFIALASLKEKEIDEKIKELKEIKKILSEKKRQIEFCNQIKNELIQVEELKEEKILVYSYNFDDDFSDILFTLKNKWGIEQFRVGFGSYISLENIKNNDFDNYEGLFTLALNSKAKENLIVREKGKYLCGYIKGKWDKLPAFYNKILNFANTKQITLEGFAYEIGLNEFVIKNEEDYITKIMIKIK